MLLHLFFLKLIVKFHYPPQKRKLFYFLCTVQKCVCYTLFWWGRLMCCCFGVFFSTPVSETATKISEMWTRRAEKKEKRHWDGCQWTTLLCPFSNQRGNLPHSLWSFFSLTSSEFRLLKCLKAAQRCRSIDSRVPRQQQQQVHFHCLIYVYVLKSTLSL